MMRAVFIGGCGRSGTTLLGAMLGAHPACVTTPESPFKIDVPRTMGAKASSIDPEQALSLIRDRFHFGLWRIAVPDASERPGFDNYPAFLMWLAGQYAEQVGRPAAGWWIDHTPDNVRWFSTLAEWLPDARLIHIVRDGRGVAASILPLDWGPVTVYQAAAWWGQKIAPGLAAESALGQKRIVRVRFEDLVTDPEATMRRVCAFVGLDYDSAVLAGTGFDTPTYTVRQHRLVGQAPDPSRATAWAEVLSAREIEVFEWMSGELLGHLGYPVLHGLASRGPSRSELWRWRAREVIGRFVSALRKRVRVRRAVRSS